LFHHHENYLFFLRQLRQYVVPASAELLVYSLMPNHYHLLIRATNDDVSHAMQNFGISFAKSLNSHFQRVGSVFQGPFQAKTVDTDEYLVHLSRYIHLNPVRAGLVRRAEDWAYSSCPEYLGTRSGTLSNAEPVLRHFAADPGGENWKSADTRRRYREFLESYVDSDRSKIAALLLDED
jgi:REP element-mobilizing transposase RayT